MIRKTGIMLYMVGLFVLMLFSQAWAVPTLQLYIPSSTYDSGSESWVTNDNPFELQALGANQPNFVYTISNVKLHIALLEDEYNAAILTPLITITDNDPNINFSRSIYANEFGYGQPSELTQPHGIYDTWYISVALPNLLVGSAGEAVQNYNPGDTGSDTGDIQYYNISFNPLFSSVHFDLTGNSLRSNGEVFKTNEFAPFSHDAETGTPPVPEPASLSLLGLGLLGLLGFRRKK